MNHKWNEILKTYQHDNTTQQLIFVKCKETTNVDISMYQKSEYGWKCILDCPGYIGRNGLGKQVQGDQKTPEGIFNLTSAFGIKDNPGTQMPYVKIHEYLYWCEDEQYYNTLIDIREKPHSCSGERLVDYGPQYHYGMVLDYNKECIYGKGTAIFLHCTDQLPYTEGCIAVEESYMIKILRNAQPGVKICIFSE